MSMLLCFKDNDDGHGAMLPMKCDLHKKYLRQFQK
jgi:hypothetical protein